MWIEPVAQVGKFLQDESKSFTFVGVPQAPDVLGEKPLGTKPSYGGYRVLIERSILAIDSFSLSYNAEIIARKSKGKDVNVLLDGRKTLEIQLANVFAHDRMLFIGQDIARVGFAAVSVIVSGPCMLQFKDTSVFCLNTNRFGCPTDSTRPAEELPKF